MTDSEQPERRLFYGWWIAFAGAFSMALSAGINFYGFSAFFVPFEQEFKWTRTALSGVFSLSRLEGGILGPIEGYLTDKLGPRKVMLVGVPLMGLGFILLSRINSLTELYLVYVLAITIGVGLGFSTPVAAAVANWFHKKRSRAFGLLWSGVAIGGGGLVPLLTWIISAHGWRTAAFVSGIIIFAVGLPVAMVMRHRPEHYGLLPDGAQPEPQRDESAVPTGQESRQVRETGEAEIGPRECLKSPAFWFLAVSVSVRSIVISGIAIHFIPMMVDRGMSLTSAGSLFGSVAFLSIIGRLGLAWLGDLVDKRYLLASTLAIMGLTMLALSRVTGFALTVVVLAVYAVVYGGSTVLPLSLQADLFGRSSFATIRGLVNTVQTGGMLIGPLFAGFVYDTSQSYFIALLGFAAASFLAMILALGAKRRTADPARA
jgi:sugar phosphate permease